MKKHIIFCLLLIFGAANLGAQSISVDSDLLGKKLDSLFKQYDNVASPGCAVSIFQDGKVIAKKAYGMASIELQVPFSQGSVVTIPYSEAREFISIAVVLMEHDGLLKLDDKVRTYFPDLPEWSAQLTLWDLLNHRSGFVDEWATLLLMYNSMTNRFETEQFLRLLYTQPTPQIEPGKGYLYSNSDFGLLRLIMEKASGETLPDWMKKRLFEPLGMINTRMQKSPLDIVPSHAFMYAGSTDDGYRHQDLQKTSPGGDYYVLTSANDLERWLAVISDSDSEISQAITKLLSNIRQIPGKENHYVIGYSKASINHHEVIFHEGVNGYTYLSRIPSNGYAVITLGNKDYDGFAEENKAMVNFLLNVSPPAFPKLITTPITLDETALTKYTGNYRWLNQTSWEGSRQTRKLSTFYIDEGKLKVRYSGNYLIELIPVAKDVFYYNEGFGMQVSFSQSSPTSPMQAEVTYDDGYPGVVMVKAIEPPWQPTKEALTGFTGTYYSEHLDFYWNISMNEAGQLVLKRTTLPDLSIEPDGLDQFHYIAEKGRGVGFDQWLLFQKDGKGNVVGMTVWSMRVMHHEFVKVND